MNLVANDLGYTPQVWLLNTDLVCAIEESGIGLNSLSDLPKHSDKLASTDIIAVAVMNYGMSLKLGSPNTMVFNEASFTGDDGEVLKAKIEKTIKEQPKLALLQAFDGLDQFYVKKTQLGFIICQGSDKPKGSDWVSLNESLFGNALLKSIYDHIGFYHLHYKDVKRAKPGEFSLANVFSVLG